MEEKEFQARLKDDPGDPLFVEYMETLRAGKDFDRAILVGVAGVSANSEFVRGRLSLARTFYEAGYLPFALQELRAARALAPENEALAKLLKKLSPAEEATGGSGAAKSSEAVAGGETMAEADFDFDDLDMLEEEQEDQ